MTPEAPQLLEQVRRQFPWVLDRARSEMYRRPAANTLRILLEALKDTAVEIGKHDGGAVWCSNEERLGHTVILGRPGQGRRDVLLRQFVDDQRAGRSTGLITCDSELARLALSEVKVRRRRQLAYFAPGDPQNPVCLNPLLLEGAEDRAGAVSGLAAALDALDPCLGQDRAVEMSLAALACHPAATLLDVAPFVDQPAFRARVTSEAPDAQLAVPSKAGRASIAPATVQALKAAIQRVAGHKPLRRALCEPRSNLRARDVFGREESTLIVDLGGLQRPLARFAGECVLNWVHHSGARLSRDRPYFLACDELPAISTCNEAVWHRRLEAVSDARLGLLITATGASGVRFELLRRARVVITTVPASREDAAAVLEVMRARGLEPALAELRDDECITLIRDRLPPTRLTIAERSDDRTEAELRNDWKSMRAAAWCNVSEGPK